MSNPLVSAIMPTKNRPQFVTLAVQMFVSQTYAPRELVIVEDGDNDLRVWLMHKFGLLKGARALLGRMVSTDDALQINVAEGVTIKYTRFEGSTGAKLNKAAQLATGEYLFRWDDDDWHHPDRLATQLSHFAMSGRAMVGLTSMIFYREGMPHGWEWWGHSIDPLGSSQAFRRDWILANPMKDRTIGEDAACAKLAREQGELFTLCGFNLIVARDHENNTGKRDDEAGRESPNSESFLKVALDDWYTNIVKSWVQNPLERTPIVRTPKKDWEAFAERVKAVQERQAQA